MIKLDRQHKSVLLAESVAALQVQPDHWYVDATFGRGGHTQAILKAGGKVLAFDWDAEAITYGQTMFIRELEEQRLLLIHSNFEYLEAELKKLAPEQKRPSGFLFDFGTSTEQLTSSERGFSVHDDGPLDMRMDTRLGVQAKDLLAAVPEVQLADLFFKFGGEEESRGVAKAIKRHKEPITTTKQLTEIISRAKKRHGGHLHPATKVFQALRIAVNSELTAIEQALPEALTAVKPEGRIVTIAFHDGEDRLVKFAFRDWEAKNMGTSITSKPITASADELNHNPRARSAKLRIFEKSK